MIKYAQSMGCLLLLLATTGCQRHSPPESASADWDDIGVSADGKSIQGIWKQVSGGDPSTVGATWIFSGSEIQFGAPSLPQGQDRMRGTYRLNSVVTPKRINWRYPPLRESYGIYVLDGATLTICVDSNSLSFDRPTVFSEDGTKDLIVLERQPAEK